MLKQEEIHKMMSTLIGMGRRLKGGFSLDYKPRIKRNEIHVLMEIKNNPHRTISDYLEFIDLESGSFTYVINKLEQKGYVIRIPVKDDRRKTILELTDKGHHVTDELERQVSIHLSHLMKELSQQDFAELNKAIGILEKILKKLGND